MNRAKDLIFSVTRKDLNITYFSGQGAGGQHRNRHNNCVRINHSESGVTVQATEHRSLIQNKTLAFKRLVGDRVFRTWLHTTASLMLKDGKTVEELVNDMMKDENLKVEEIIEGRWVVKE